MIVFSANPSRSNPSNTCPTLKSTELMHARYARIMSRAVSGVDARFPKNKSALFGRIDPSGNPVGTVGGIRKEGPGTMWFEATGSYNGSLQVAAGRFVIASNPFTGAGTAIPDTAFVWIQGGQLSTAGARGPMQFIPSSWAAYGNGGDVDDNRDAILAAGRYLRAAGGPADMDKAIFAYNHDSGYVTAVQSYARNLLADPRAYDGYYNWQVYYRTVDGAVLLPEGYTPGGTIGPRALPPA